MHSLRKITGSFFSLGLLAVAAAGTGCDDGGATAASGGDGGTGATPSTGGSGAQGGSGGSGAQGGTGGQGGSGGGPTGPATYGNGSRLRARVLDAGGGAAQFVSWFDTQIQQQCWMAKHEDGSTRCLPIGPSIAYRDAACTDPVAYTAPCWPEPSFLSEQVSQAELGCVSASGEQASIGQDRTYRVRSVGAPADMPSTLYFDYSGCSPFQPPAEATIHEIGAVEPAGSFVAAAYEEEPVAGGLVLQREVADDGAWVARGLKNESGGFCGAVKLGDEHRCVPGFSALLDTKYSDASCTEKVASYASVKQGCPAPAYIPSYVQDPSGCGTQLELLSVGPELEPAMVYTYSPDCKPLAPADPSPVYYAPGAPLDPATFPPLAVGLRGSERLRIEGLEAVDGTWLSHGERFVDTEIGGGVTCEPFYFPDGAYRCVPQSYVNASPIYHADDACAVPLHLVQKPKEGCAPLPPPTFQVTYGDGSTFCSEVPNNGTVGEIRPFVAHAGPIYSSIGPGCQMIGPELGTVYDFYVLGEPVPFETFPALELHVE